MEVFDLDSILPIEIPVKIDGKDYTLKEASEEVSVRFRSSQLRDARFVDGKLSANIERVAESQAILVAGCLWDDKGKNPTVDAVRKMTSWKVRKLFEKAKEISKLDEEETKESLTEKMAKMKQELDNLERNGDSSKNLLSGTTATSA